MVAYGFNSLTMALFLQSLDFSDPQIGAFMTLTLLGDVLLSVFLTLIADRFGRRRILFAGSLLMVVSGAAFAFFENFWILLLAAVVGVISATGGDCGPFRAIEESILSGLTTSKTRNDVLAWYVTSSGMATSMGSELAGRMVHYLQGREGWTLIDSYHAVFWVLIAMGLVNMLLTCMLSDACEAKPAPAPTEEDEILLHDRNSIDGEEEISLQTQSQKPAKKPSRLQQISPQTRAVMYKVWALLALDSFADGMTPYTLKNYYLDQKFKLPKSALGDITAVSQWICAFVAIFASPIARRIGLINTMVFTHLPSSLAIGFVPLPRSVGWTSALLMVNAALNSLDQAPRAAFIAAVVKSEERTAVMGITSMLRTLAQSTGPTATGILSGNSNFWIAFVAASTLRIIYDVGLFVMFVNMKLNQHEENEPKSRKANPRHSSDEEEPEDLPKQVAG
ncbi:MFS general substrate transporter [Venturia nashicola]|nr:MFS general substrate transporter [Venturia nashicola]